MEIKLLKLNGAMSVVDLGAMLCISIFFKSSNTGTSINFALYATIDSRSTVRSQQRQSFFPYITRYHMQMLVIAHSPRITLLLIAYQYTTGRRSIFDFTKKLSIDYCISVIGSWLVIRVFEYFTYCLQLVSRQTLVYNILRQK